MNEINSITIVGGGSSGWMTAATLIRFFPNKKITIIEPENIPTIGVGESTLGSINNWLNFIGIKKEDFMKESDASYKLSIKFKGFYHENDEAFHYPFGFPMFEILDDFGGPEEWHLLKSLNKKLSITDYVNCFYSSSSLINNNKYSENLNNQFENYNPDVDSAVHFDAIKFANWLKNNICLPEGVSLINSHVVDVSVNELGIEKIILSNGDIIESDLFIDCTGFKSILLSSVGDNKFIDYSDIIPNNSAWAARVPYSNKEKELEPYTTCTALKNGWAWNIPLWSRIGTGYVYSNKFISKENSLKEFKEYLSNKFLIDPEVLDFNHIDFKVGIYEKTWIGNVVAIG